MVEVATKSPRSPICLECGGDIDYGNVCNLCGLLVNNKTHLIKTGPKRNAELNPTTILTSDIALSTHIPKDKIESLDFKRAARRDTWVYDSVKKNILKANSILTLVHSRLNFSISISKRAMRLYKDLKEIKPSIRGFTIRNLIAACVLYASREYGFPIIIKELAKEIQPNTGSSARTKRSIRKGLTFIKTALKLKNIPLQPYRFVNRFVSELGLDTSVASKVIRIIKKYIEEIGYLDGKSHRGYCAAAIYIVCKATNILMRQADISNIAGVTEVTLRSRQKDILSKLNIVIK